MSTNNLIEQLEEETGQRIDHNNGDNLAMAGLIGALSRLMGQSPSSYRKCDDIAAGTLIQHRMSPQYQREQETKEAVAALLALGMSPNDL